METPELNCFFLYRPKSALGLVGLVGWPDASLGNFYSAGSSRSFHQGLRSGGSGLARPPSAGVRHREGRKQENGAPPQQRPRRGEPLSLLVWCSPFGPVWEATPDSPEQRGGFHKEGEGPSFGDSFVSFSSLRKRPQRSASPLPDWQFCARFTIKSETIQNFCIVSFFIYLAAHRSSRYAPQSATRENTLPGLRRSRASVTPSCQAADRQVTPTWSQESTSVAVSPI